MSEPHPEAPRAPAKPLLLLVDDVPTNLHLLAALLKADYRIKTATSGQAALDLIARTEHPELILLDVMMPGMSGIEVLRHLRADHTTHEIPVIFVSADTSEQTQLDGLELGADDYLTKPVVGTVLRARVKNILARKRNERQLRLAAHVFDYSGEAILITDRDNCIIEANPAFTRLTGYSAEEVRGQDPRILSSGRNPRALYAEMWRAIKDRGFWQGELWDRHKNGATEPRLVTISTVCNPHGEIDYHISTFSDIREQKATEERIRRIAYHDSLTGLPNRLHLSAALEQALNQAQRSGTEVALLFIDMDRFKLINDTLGHQVGDELLVEVAQRLKACVRESDIVARQGGDEFVVAITGLSEDLAATAVVGKILASLGQPYLIGQRVLHSSPSIGISIYPVDGTDATTLMKHADAAMYHAKDLGRNQVQYFKAELNAQAQRRLELETDLRGALASQQFELHYQPKWCTKSQRISGVEALLRWHHPRLGLVPPLSFIPLAEETGLIDSIGQWVLEQACGQLAAWRDAGIVGLSMSTNLSAHQLRSAQLLPSVRALLERFALQEDEIEFEITESVAMTNPAQAIELLRALRALGVRLAIDDFGTGYSSLAYLKHLPIQCLKVDKGFVRDIETDSNDAAICAATIALAHQLGLEVVAEGVETQAQSDFLTKLHHCDQLQGYLIGRPMPAATLTPLLRQSKQN
ncbi:EAL domain-containing response regulator [Serpentinimonas barnesii]|uniref:EAL domain-containing response regulator n=1 Tax=Serpentinimonas barnesii TaxID=1458427 RepID=UPI0005EFF0E3|nr:EAL domain-containing protein [Serpentinimonas barnesii]